MATVLDVIKRLFPYGTNVGVGDHKHFPVWPPDMFAIAATLIEKTGCYTHKQFGGYSTKGLFRDPYPDEISKLAAEWTLLILPHKLIMPRPPVVVKLDELWHVLLAAAEQIVEREEKPCEETLQWWEAVIKLLAISDEASAGMGFTPRPNGALLSKRTVSRKFADLVLSDYGKVSSKEKPKFLPDPAQTLCKMVPSYELCVQPKTITSQIGCSLRSLTHHLALLPSVGEVKTQWMVIPTGTTTIETPLNLLLVPFPYRIDGTSFVPGGTAIDHVGPTAYEKQQPNFFAIEQKWLDGVDPKTFADFLIGLVGESHREVDRVHGIILPELALEHKLAEDVAKKIAVDTKLELFVTGVASKTTFPASAVYGCIFADHEVTIQWIQPKHHRWKLNADQIRRYHLGNTLSPEGEWWEKIDIGNRYCYFYLFRPGAAMAALVCEDLARIDPVQPVLRAIGPNLVIALLMDGPQLPFRWANRYATVLADDPGSAVLTLTSLGMLRRSIDPGDVEPDTVGLWKDPLGSKAVELKLPKAASALLLTITCSRSTECTLDRRTDNGGTVKLKLMGVRPISRPSKSSDFGLHIQ